MENTNSITQDKRTKGVKTIKQVLADIKDVEKDLKENGRDYSAAQEKNGSIRLSFYAPLLITLN